MALLCIYADKLTRSATAMPCYSCVLLTHHATKAVKYTAYHYKC